MNEDREKLAESSYRKRSAVHKGRAHFYAYQVRQRKKKALSKAKEAETIRVNKLRKYKMLVTKYWSGDLQSFPSKPR